MLNGALYSKEEKMYKIEKKDFGYKLTFGGFIKLDEMKQWVDESKKTLESSPSKFGVMVDMRELKPLPKDAQEHMQVGQKSYKDKGMERSVVILNSAVLTVQFKRIAKETGIYDWERYINAAKDSNWEETGIKWLVDALDPDK